MPGFEDAGLETAQAVLEECAKLNQEVLAPLNWEGDKNPSAFANGEVKTTPGFKDAFKQYGEGKVCSTPQILVARVCLKPLALHAVKCSIRPT